MALSSIDLGSERNDRAVHQRQCPGQGEMRAFGALDSTIDAGSGDDASGSPDINASANSNNNGWSNTMGWLQ